MDPPQTLSFHRRNLPHWRVAERPYFITFRLKGSLPQQVIQRLRTEYQALRAEQPSEDRKLALQRQYFMHLDESLDQASDGPRWLEEPSVAKLLMQAFDWVEHKRGWEIPTAVVMPNHVHCLVFPGKGAVESLDKTFGVLKGFTARQANKILNRTGRPFWTPESFDHWCRTPEKAQSVSDYIRDNPVKAGLVKRWQDWPWLRKR